MDYPHVGMVVLSTLGIGLERKAPVTSLSPVLCTVSIILSADDLAFINRK